MSITKNIISQLLHYVMNNEVVYQFCGELMEVFYDNEKENKATLLSYLSRAKRIEVYDKLMLSSRTVGQSWLIDRPMMMYYFCYRTSVC